MYNNDLSGISFHSALEHGGLQYSLRPEVINTLQNKVRITLNDFHDSNETNHNKAEKFYKAVEGHDLKTLSIYFSYYPIKKDFLEFLIDTAVEEYNFKVLEFFLDSEQHTPEAKVSNAHVPGDTLDIISNGNYDSELKMHFIGENSNSFTE